MKQLFAIQTINPNWISQLRQTTLAPTKFSPALRSLESMFISGKYLDISFLTRSQLELNGQYLSKSLNN
jgi:hypothetical protein